MNPVKTIAAVAATAVALSTTTTMADTVTLFDNSFFQGNSVTITVNPLVKECYNIVNCFNDRASSAAWNIYSLTQNSFVYFYNDVNCGGAPRAWPVGTAPPNNFAIDGINDVISSIKVGDWRFDISTGRIINACPFFSPLGVAESNATAVNANENGAVIGEEKPTV